VDLERQEGMEAYHRSPPDRGDVALKAPNMLEVVCRFSWGEAIGKVLYVKTLFRSAN